MAPPEAIPQAPAVGVCGFETDCQGDSLAAGFLDPSTNPCDAPCNNSWNGCVPMVMEAVC